MVVRFKDKPTSSPPSSSHPPPSNKGWEDEWTTINNHYIRHYVQQGTYNSFESLHVLGDSEDTMELLTHDGSH